MVGSRVYVGGLPYGCREKDLEKFFKGYGRIRDILLKNGYGFVVSYCLQGNRFHVKFLFLKEVYYGIHGLKLLINQYSSRFYCALVALAHF